MTPVPEALAFYRRAGPHTDPGEFAGLYEGLPSELDELCDLIGAQLIHPAAVERYRDVLPAGRSREDPHFYSVRDMLAELVARNPDGLRAERAPAERLVLSCRYFAMLLVSLLRHQGVAARVRVGFAPYVAPESGRHIDHWIAQVWDRDKGGWIFVDPDLRRIDFEGFELAGEVWQGARRGEIDPAPYGYHIWWGLPYVLSNTCHDFFACVNQETVYWEGPELFHKDVEQLSADELSFVDQLAALLGDPDTNLEELLQLRADHPLLQNTRGAPPDL